MTILVVAILIVFAVFSLKKPVPAAGLILGLAPAYLIRFKVLGLPTTLLELLLLTFFLAVFATASKDRYRETFKKLKFYVLPIIFFVLAATVSTLLSPEATRALGQLKAFFLEPVGFLFAVMLISPREEDLMQMIRWLFAGAIVVSVFGLLQYFTGFLLPVRFWGYGMEPRRISSFFEYPNALALYLAPLSAMFLHLLLEKKLSNSAWVGWLIMLIALGLTFSRGGWLGLLGGAFIALSLRFSFKKTLTVIMLVVALLIISPVTRGRITAAFTDASYSAHLQLAKTGWNKITESPVKGNGLSGFRTALAESGFKGEVLNYPHNIFLNFWLETGVLGLLSFLATGFIIIVMTIRKPTALRWAVCAFLVALWLHGQVDVPYLKNDLALLYWFAVAVAII